MLALEQTGGNGARAPCETQVAEPPSGVGDGQRRRARDGSVKRIWKQSVDDGLPVAITVNDGVSDGSVFEVTRLHGERAEGEQIVAGIKGGSGDAARNNSPPPRAF